jgi:hypothetical protein
MSNQGLYSVTVPSTNGNQDYIGKEEHIARVNEVKHWLSNLFGGFTLVSDSPGFGGWYNGKIIIEEPIYNIYAYTNAPLNDSQLEELDRQLIERFGAAWEQECIARVYLDGSHFDVEFLS